MNPAQKLAASKAGEHMGRRPMDPKPKGKNFLQKAGEFITGGATAKELTSPSWWTKGLANEANQSIVQPVYRTASGQNLRTAVAPSSTLNQRISAIGEDALNVLGIIPMAAPAARASVAAERAGARALAGAKAKMTPTADLSTYIFHGGPKPENLAGGVLSPKYVRGGDEYAELYANRGRQPSVKSGPNQLEKDSILKQFEDAKKFLSTEKPFTSKPGWQSTRDYVKDMKEKTNQAENFIKEHEEIVQRILSGEEHQTGVYRLNPGDSYHNLYGTEGGTHILDIPRNLQTSQTPAPAGEVKFWGDVKPSAFIPYVDNQSRSTTETLITQAMLDDADKKSIRSQGLANMFARATGSKITPAYKKYVSEVLDSELRGSFKPYTRNPDYMKTDRDILEYFTDFTAQPIPKIQNRAEINTLLNKAKTKEEVMSILDKMIPAEQLDILLQGGMRNQGTFPELLQNIKGRLDLLDPSYSRLKK